METEKKNFIVEDWQAVVNKPVYTSNGKDIGVVRSVQPQFIVSALGRVTEDKYLIPKTSVQTIENGVVYIKEDSDFAEKNFRIV
jgi:sporulation protein YlmC with PRC-barrel domain